MTRRGNWTTTGTLKRHILLAYPAAATAQSRKPCHVPRSMANNGKGVRARRPSLIGATFDISFFSSFPPSSLSAHQSGKLFMPSRPVVHTLYHNIPPIFPSISRRLFANMAAGVFYPFLAWQKQTKKWSAYPMAGRDPATIHSTGKAKLGKEKGRRKEASRPARWRSG